MKLMNNSYYKYLNKQKTAYVSGILIKEVLLNSKQYHIWLRLFDFPFYELEQFAANFIFLIFTI